MMLVPGRPTGKLLSEDGDSWQTIVEDLPRWAMSAALQDGVLTLIGAVQGTLMVEEQKFDL